MAAGGDGGALHRVARQARGRQDPTATIVGVEPRRPGPGGLTCGNVRRSSPPRAPALVPRHSAGAMNRRQRPPSERGGGARGSGGGEGSATSAQSRRAGERSRRGAGAGWGGRQRRRGGGNLKTRRVGDVADATPPPQTARWPEWAPRRGSKSAGGAASASAVQAQDVAAAFELGAPLLRATTPRRRGDAEFRRPTLLRARVNASSAATSPPPCHTTRAITPLSRSSKVQPQQQGVHARGGRNNERKFPGSAMPADERSSAPSGITPRCPVAGGAASRARSTRRRG